MASLKKSPILPRKNPRQARSTELVSAILQAASRILQRDGAARFTTTRVAERAGVSVGSLYQYFPNKAAILYRLQSDEWRETAGRWQAVLADSQTPPLGRLRTLVHLFIRSECDESAPRLALNRSASLDQDSPEPPDDGSEPASIETLLREAIPEAPEPTRRLAADLIETTLTEAGRHFSDSARSADEIEACATAMADMFCAYVTTLGRS